MSEDYKNPYKYERTRTKKWLLFFLVLLLLAMAVLAGFFIFSRGTASPVPKNIQKTVSFPIYYPEQAKLPPGYHLNLNSFGSPRPDVIVYSVSKTSGQTLTFSLQLKPDEGVIQNFNNRVIPLRTPYQTRVGLAQIGAYKAQKTQAIASLLTNNNIWIIVTAPDNISQDEFKQIISSLRK